MTLNIKVHCTKENISSCKTITNDIKKKNIYNITKATQHKKNEIMREFGKEIINNTSVKITYINDKPFNTYKIPSKTSTLKKTKHKSKPPPQHNISQSIPIISNPNYSEYINDIHSYLNTISSQTLPLHNYISSVQTDITSKMRSILFEWLIEVHVKFNLLPETLFLTFNIIDRYLSKISIQREHFQLLGITAMLISCKYEEICSPEINDFIYITDNSYTKAQVIKLEENILKVIKFNMNYVSPLHFIEIYKQYLHFDNKCLIMCQYLIEICLVNYNMIKYSSKVIAICVIYIERNLNSDININNEDYYDLLWNISGYTKNDEHIQSCLKDICILLDNINKGKYSFIKKKYSSDKYMNISTYYHKQFPII